MFTFLFIHSFIYSFIHFLAHLYVCLLVQNEMKQDYNKMQYDVEQGTMTKFNGKSLLCAEQDVKRYNCYQKFEIKVLMERIGECVCVSVIVCACNKKRWLSLVRGH